MKRLSLYLFLIFFTFQTPSQADDIRDFQIEGMSVGDSLLDYFSEEEIKEARKYKYKSDNFYSIDILDVQSALFNGFQFHLKKEDYKYIIHGVSGAIIYGEVGIYYPQSEKKCKKQMKIVEKDIDSIFSNAKKETKSGVGIDYDKEAIRHDVYFTLNSGDIYLQCVTFGKKAKKKEYIFDSLRLTILTKEFSNWITHEAYK